MEPNAPPDFIRSPLGIALLMLASTIGGGWVKDRLATEQRDGASAVRIDALDRRLSDLETVNARRFEEIRQDLRDLKTQIEAREARK